MISGGGNSESRSVSAVLNSDGASKSCVNWGSRGTSRIARRLSVSACCVARRAVDCCPSRMAAFDVDVWLGAEVTIKGKDETLPDRVQEALKKGFEEDLWTEADVPDEGTTLDEADMLVRLALFGAAHEDSCKILKQECFKTDKIRFARWFRAGYGEEVTLDATLAPVTVTPEFALDMAAQGMTSPGDLFGLELALAVGRPVAAEETLGAAYGRPASSMVGAKDSAKAQKHTGGCKMLDTLLSEARKSGDKIPVMRHFQDLSYRLSNSTIMPYNAKAAVRILTFVNKASQNIREDLAWIIYMQDVRTQYMGRGLPMKDLFDVELAMSAKEQSVELQKKGIAPGSRPRPLSELVYGGVCGDSDVGSFGPGLGPSAGVAPSAIADALALALRPLQEGLLLLCTRVEGLELGGPPKTPTDRKCWHCGSTSHIGADCEKEKKKRKAALAAAAAAGGSES